MWAFASPTNVFIVLVQVVPGLLTQRVPDRRRQAAVGWATAWVSSLEAVEHDRVGVKWLAEHLHRSPVRMMATELVALSHRYS